MMQIANALTVCKQGMKSFLFDIFPESLDSGWMAEPSLIRFSSTEPPSRKATRVPLNHESQPSSIEQFMPVHRRRLPTRPRNPILQIQKFLQLLR